MEFENIEILQHTTPEDSYPKIYSARAVWGFTIFFSSIFGAVLLMQNLKDIGKRKDAYLVLIGSIIYTVITLVVVNIPERPVSNIALIFNFAGGGVLSYLFKNKYFPNEDVFQKKTIWKPLIISIMIAIPLFLAAIYTSEQ